MAEVIIINPNRQTETAKKRVTAYVRVSSDSADQLHSFAAQMDYYTHKIAENPDWEFVNIYADEGLTGLATDKRVEFNHMMRDARRGKLDVILVKKYIPLLTQHGGLSAKHP